MKLSSIWDGWRRFWFEPTGTTGICIYRILFGILVLQIAVVHLAGHFEEWYGPHSMTPLPTVINHFWFKEPRFDLFLLLPQTDTSMAIAYVLFVVAAVCLCVGLFSNYAAFVVWLMLLSMHHHNPYNINGGDAFLRAVAPFIAFSHCGDRFSLDAIIARKSGRAVPALRCPWAQRMIQVQIALVYWQTFCCKMAGSQWLDGTAVYYATRLDDMIRFPMPFISDNMLLLRALDYFTLIIEFAGWTLIFVKELRYYVLAGLLGLHLGIDYLINLPVFEWAFIFTLVTFIEARDLDYVLLWTRTKVIGRRKTSPATEAIWH